MKLLNKTQIYYLVLVLVLLVAWSGIFLYTISQVIQSGIDETLQSDLEASINRIKSQPSGSSLSYMRDSSLFELSGIDSIRHPGFAYSDTLMYNSVEKEAVPYRQISTERHIGGRSVRITQRKSTVEYDDLFYTILLTELLFVVVLIGALYWMNRRLIKSLWKPFFATLDEASRYRLAGKDSLSLPQTGIEEFQQLNEVLQNMITHMEHDYQSMKAFTENASHEIQSPLAVISNNIEIFLQDESLTRKQRENLYTTQKTAGKLSRLNKALLMLTKIENDQYTHKEEVDLSGLLKSLMSDYRALAESRDIALTEHFEPGIIFTMNAELAELMFRNLLGNAVKHNHAGGYIDITLDKARLVIKNSGALTDKKPDQLFGRFQKGQGSSQSLGLGLSIVAAIAKSNGFKLNYSIEKDMHRIEVGFF